MHYAYILKDNLVERATGVYEPEPKGGWFWLQRLAAWILRKLGREHTVLVSEPSFQQIILNHVLDAVQEQINSLYYQGKLPKYIVMGRQAQKDFFRSVCRSYVSDILQDYEANIYERTYKGLKLVLLSHAEGLLVLPSLES